jgi:hypothetical protein
MAAAIAALAVWSARPLAVDPLQNRDEACRDADRDEDGDE